jgi:hypothetical protein
MLELLPQSQSKVSTTAKPCTMMQAQVYVAVQGNRERNNRRCRLWDIGASHKLAILQHALRKHNS